MALPSSPTIVPTPAALGAIARARREQSGLALRTATPLTGVGLRFLSEFERGKPSAQLGKVFSTLHGLNLDLAVITREPAQPAVSLSQAVGTEFPYDWSNGTMDSGAFIRKVLRARRFNDVLKTVHHFGFDRVRREIAALSGREEAAKAAAIVGRVCTGLLQAEAQRVPASAP